ncbi:hypothetical protein LR48_Vigan10g060400 [Vigna angularis]|uniref:Uncharacterized protein n=1 Tax=Phaseolus angularis TaxID=3914 RepID=A0A0L9VIH7_PHAAN|nr:hypothetical protein LR48_Vigan10g060400 [Vigna angularis]
MERKAGLIPDLAPRFGEQLENRNWGRLATYPTQDNIAVVKEFYTNARRLGGYPAEEGADFGDMESVLCMPGGNFQRNMNGAVVNIRRADLTPLANTVEVRMLLSQFHHAVLVERGPAQSQTSADTHEAEPFQMRDMYMSLIGAQLQSIHRGQVATAEMIVGMYDTPPAHRWNMDEFHNVVAWPEEPIHGGGAGAAEASARDMEEDEAEE